MNHKVNFLIVEDETKKAIRYYSSLDLNDVFNQVAFVTSLDQAVDFLLDEPPPSVFWVDIQLGSNQYDGIEVLRHIKNRCPQSLVIVYTAHEVEKQCKSIGLLNLHYIEKNTSTIEEDFNQIKTAIKGFISTYKSQDGNLPTSYSAQIAHIDEKNNWVKLECHINGKIIERLFDSGPIEQALKDDFFVDSWVQINVTKKDNKITIVFEKKENPPKVHGPEDDDIISDDELIDSKIWRQDRNS